MEEPKKKIKKPYDKLEMIVVDLGKTCIMSSSLDNYGNQDNQNWPDKP